MSSITPADPLGGVRARVGALLELVHDLAPAHERAGENLREEGDVEGVAGQPEGRRAPGPQVRQVHDVVEGEERDPERQGEVDPRKIEAGDQVGEIGEEAEILEKAEHREVAGQCDREQPA
nr:hypothetical protein [Methylorubrum aminovorans]